MNARRNTIVIGMGNPVLCDDSVGLKIARSLEKALLGVEGVAVTELCAGGVRLMEAMVGYDRAIIIDATLSQNGEPGTVYSLNVDGASLTHNTCSTHDASLAMSMDLGKMAGLHLPEDIRIWAIEAGDVKTFSETLTDGVAAAVPVLTARVIQDVMQEEALCSERRT
jgi:hydrogenase maturation protease